MVAAFGLIFRQRTLDIPRFGSINVHPSLLPKYRGASPIVAAIASGDRETGVSLMVMDAGIDTGAVVSQERALVADDDTSESLGGRLAEHRRRDGVAGHPALGHGRAGSVAAGGFAGESDADADEGRRLDRLDATGGRNRAADSRHVAVATRMDDHPRNADPDP